MLSSEPAFPPTPYRLVASVTDPSGRITTMTYALTDPSSATTHPTEEGTTTIYEYEVDGELIAVIDVRLHHAASTYDATDSNVSPRSEEDGADRPHIIVPDPIDGATGDYRKE